MAIRDAVQSLGIQLRAGLHTGECEVRGDHGELVGAHGKSTIDRLHALAGRGWRPQDCALIDGYCARFSGG